MNKTLGELEVEILGERYTLKPTFEGLIEMESRSGLTIAALLSRFTFQSAGMKDVAGVIYGGMLGANDGKPSLSFQEVGEMITRHGFNKLLVPCAKFVGAAYSGKSIDEIDANIADKEEKKKERVRKK